MMARSPAMRMATVTMIITTIITVISTDMPGAETELFDLMSWMSPAWPIGAFAYSGGLEWAVEDGLVRDRDTTVDWIAALLDHGSLRNDTVAFAHTWRAVTAGDETALAEIAELAAAVLTSHERRLESCAQGAAFRRIALATTGASRYSRLLQPIPDDGLSYPVAAATLFACQGIGLRGGLTAFLHGGVSNMVSAAQRLVPLGQTDGQLVIRQLRPAVLALAEFGCALPQGDPFAAMGGCTLVADLGAMAHETQYTRLFRT